MRLQGTPRRLAADEREKRRAAEAVARLDALAFSDSAVAKAGNVLESLLDSADERERRLAAERIRDERGLTRVVKPAEHAHLHVTLEPWVSELASQRQPRPVTVNVEQPRALKDR